MSVSQSNLPELVAWLQALSVPSLGCLAAWIAYQQWRTAERKIQLDLFDRRFAIYDAARQALHPVIREGRCEGQEIVEFRNGTETAFLLFGPEVIQEINEVVDALGKLTVCTHNMKSGPPYDSKDIQIKSESIVRISAFFQNMPILIEPYMALANKAGARSVAPPSTRLRKPQVKLLILTMARRLRLTK